MSNNRDLNGAANRLAQASDYELEMILKRDPDMIRDVAAALTASRLQLVCAENTVDILESNARVQAKLLADTGRNLEKAEADLFAAMEVVCGVIVACERQFNVSPSMARVREQAISLVKPKPNCTQTDDLGCSSAVERLAVNEDVAGSIPADPATKQTSALRGQDE